MSRPFVHKVTGPITTLWHFSGPLWAWTCQGCGAMGYMEVDRVSVFNRAANHVCPDTRKPQVQKLPFSQVWTWQCHQCCRYEMDSTATQLDVFRSAHNHATSGKHYVSRYM